MKYLFIFFATSLILLPIILSLSTLYFVRPFVQGFDHDMLSAWSIHRWYNLKSFERRDCNILYLDSDTIFYDNVQYLFDTYCYYDVYGREEYGFRFDPNIGGGVKIREFSWIKLILPFMILVEEVQYTNIVVG